MRTPITYYGGKQSMLNEILPLIPQHKIYCEPYFGGGAVFFAKQLSYLEVINDTNDRLISFYTAMQCNFDDLNQMIEDTLHSERMHQEAKDIYHGRKPAEMLELAWSVWVVTNMSFAGSVYGGWKWCNGNAGSHTGRFIRKKRNEFSLLRSRLQDVQISNRDAIEVIIKRDSAETFFFIDPPYPGSDQGHYSGFTMKNFIDLLEILSTIQGKFILSNFWSQSLRFFIHKSSWKFRKIKKLNKVQNLNVPRYKTEVLVWNFNTENNLFSSQNQNQ